MHLSSHASDHLPLLLHIQSFSQPRHHRGISFRFKESWLLRAECADVIYEAWGNAGVDRDGLAAVQETIKACGADLMAWGSLITDPDMVAIKETQMQLDRLNEAKLTEASKAEFLSLSKKMDELLQKREIY